MVTLAKQISSSTAPEEKFLGAIFGSLSSSSAPQQGPFRESVLSSTPHGIVVISPSSEGVVKIEARHTTHLKFNIPIPLIFEKLGDSSYLCSAPDLGIYSNCDSFSEAHSDTLEQIDGLWEDLNEDDNLTREWLLVRDFLRATVVDG